MIDEAGKNARRIFYASLTNSGMRQTRWYSDGYYAYIHGYMESLKWQKSLFIIGTKLSILSQVENLLCKMSKIIPEYNYGFRMLVQPVLDAGISALPPEGCKGQAVLWNIVTKMCTISVLLSKIVNGWMESTRPTRRDSAAGRTKSRASRGTKVRNQFRMIPWALNRRIYRDRLASRRARGLGRPPFPFVTPALCRGLPGGRRRIGASSPLPRGTADPGTRPG
jgi:hypothetical protein